MARVEVITGPERRRRWSEEQKRVIVAASLAPAVPSDGRGAELGREPAIEVEFAGKVRVRIPASVSKELAAAVVKALSRR